MNTTRRAKWSFTGIGVFGAVLAIMIGLPGFVDDLRAWKLTIDKARLSNTDWSIWFLIGLGFAIVAVGPWVLPNIYARIRARWAGKWGTHLVASDEPTKSDNSGLSSHLQGESLELQEVLDERASLTAQLDDARSERDRERGDKETLARETTELRLALHNREDSLREAYWNVRFGHSRPIIPDLPIAEADAIRLRTQEARPALVKAVEKFDALFLNLLNQMRSYEEGTGVPWLAGFISEYPARRMSVAWRALTEVLDYSDDIRRHVVGFCWNYSEAKMWLVRVLNLLEWPPEVAPAYERWREADQALNSELERLLARNSMQSVRAQVQLLHAVDLPPWPA